MSAGHLNGGITITFRKSGRRVVWDDAALSLLEFAEIQGLSPAFSCRAGVCNTCKTALLQGEVSYFEEPLDAPELGQVLLCCALPICDLTLGL